MQIGENQKDKLDERVSREQMLWEGRSLGGQRVVFQGGGVWKQWQETIS